MGINRKLTASEVAAITMHNANMIEHCTAAIRTLRQVKAGQRTPYMVNQIQYWKSAIGAFKWSSQLARQSQERVNHV